MAGEHVLGYAHPKGSIIRDPGKGILLAHGTTVPADASTGYATGCIFLHTDGGNNDAVYINEGTVTSALFNVVSVDAPVDFTALTATVAEINVAADGSANTVVVAAGGAAVTPLAGGGTYLVPLVTANVTMTLPAAALGEKHRFCFIGSAADAEDWVITSPTLLVGGFSHFDVGGTSAAVYANGSSHTIVTVNNPAAGTDITFIGDGTNWACTGQVSSADPHAFS